MFSAPSTRGFLLGTASGVLSGAGLWFPVPVQELSAHYLPGVYFAVLVLILPNWKRQRWWQALGLILSAVGIYYFAVQFAIAQYGIAALSYFQATMISGVLGAAVMLAACRLLMPLRLDLVVMAGALAAGLAGGIAMGYYAGLGDHGWGTVSLFSGYILWQAGVGAFVLMGTDPNRWDPAPIPSPAESRSG